MRSLLALCVLLSSPATAAVTADELWADLQRLAAQGGTPLTAEVQRAGAELILSRPTLDLGTADKPVTLQMERLILRENADGTVSVIVPDRFPLILDLPESTVPSDPDALTIMASAPGLDVRVSDLGSTAAFSILAPSLSLALDPVEMLPGDDVNLSLATADLRLDHRQDLGPLRSTVVTSLALGTLHVDGLLALADGEGGTFALDLSRIAASVDLDLNPTRLQDRQASLGALLADMTEEQGFEAKLEHGPISFAATLADDKPGATDVRLTSETGRASLQFERSGFSTDVVLGKTSFFAALDDPEVPFSELDVSYSELAAGLALGVAGVAEPVDVSVFGRFVDLALSDPLWDQMDPAKVFPRDPLSADVALSGQVREKPRAGSDLMGADVPVEVLSLSLERLRLAGLGVVFSGNGALTFDNTDLVTFDGAPAPTGTVTFSAQGLNALLDRIVAAGMFPAEDLTGLRFGLAFIGKPDGAPDSLTSRVEFREKSLYLNGVKMR